MGCQPKGLSGFGNLKGFFVSENEKFAGNGYQPF
jgi:hypothetical protein